MIEGLKPYADSAKTKPMTRTSEINIPWLTAIPEHWKIVRSKGLFTARTERARPDDEQLSATQAYGVIPQKEFENRVGRKVVRITQNLEKRAHVEPDDFVISMRSFQGGLERAWARGCIRSSYVVLKPSPETEVGYFAHLFKSVDYIRALQATSNFIRDGQDLNFNNFSLVDLPLPPLDEQAAIAKCLDHANRKIDGFIRAKRKLIGLLNEQKQAIIHRAVTRGLDADAPLKPSGIPWLGEIPAHWEVRRLRFCIRGKLTYGANAAAEFDNPDWPRYLRITDFNGDGSLRPDTFRSLPPEIAKDYPVEDGDILFARSGATVGKAFIVRTETVKACYAGYLIRARPNTDVVMPPFLFAFTQSTAFVRWKDAIFNRATIQNIGADKYANLVVPIPLITEQQSILDAIEIDLLPLRTAITRTEREIALMQEYCTRLTADIVTGKLDVREAAAKLPDLPTDSAGEVLTDEALDDSETEDAEA